MIFFRLEHFCDGNNLNNIEFAYELRVLDKHNKIQVEKI